MSRIGLLLFLIVLDVHAQTFNPFGTLQGDSALGQHTFNMTATLIEFFTQYATTSNTAASTRFDASDVKLVIKDFANTLLFAGRTYVEFSSTAGKWVAKSVSKLTVMSKLGFQKLGTKLPPRAQQGYNKLLDEIYNSAFAEFLANNGNVLGELIDKAKSKLDEVLCQFHQTQVPAGMTSQLNECPRNLNQARFDGDFVADFCQNGNAHCHLFKRDYLTAILDIKSFVTSIPTFSRKSPKQSMFEYLNMLKNDLKGKVINGSKHLAELLMGQNQASSCFVSRRSASGYHQQCCYDGSTNLCTKPPCAGRPVRGDPSNYVARITRDVIPYLQCCAYAKVEWCDKFTDSLPPNNLQNILRHN